MPDDPYVPVGGWDAAGYSGFSTPDIAATTINPMATPTYQPAYDPQQRLATTDSSYAQMRGWNPDPNAMNNAGPALVGGSWGGLLSPAYQYGSMERAPAQQPLSNLPTLPGAETPMDSRSFQPAPLTNPTGAGGDYNDSFNAPYTPPYGDLSGSQQTPIDTSFQNPSQSYQMPTTPTTFGDLSASAATGGAGLGGYQPQPAYASPAGGAGLGGYQPQPAYASPAGGAELQPFQGHNAYNDFATRGAAMPGQQFGGLLGSSMPSPTPVTPPSPYGSLSNTAATGGAELGGYQPQPTYASPAGGAALDRSVATGGAELQPFQGYNAYNDFGSRGATMPGGEYGSLGGSSMPSPTPTPAPPVMDSSGVMREGGADLPAPNAQPISANASSLFSGGAGLEGYQPQPTYASPAGGATLDRSIATGGAELQPFQGHNAYNDFATRGATMPGQAFGLLGSPQSEQPITPTETTDYTGGAGLLGGPTSIYAPPEQGAQFAGSQNARPDFTRLPTPPSPAAEQAGRDIGATQYSSYPLDRSQVPTSTVERGTPLGELPYPNDAERMRLMRTINGEDPQNPEAILWSIQNRLATQQQPNEVRYGNTIGTGVSPLNNGTDAVTRGNQYNAFSQAGYNRDNFAGNVAGFNETNPNYQRYSDAIDRVWNAPSSQDPTSGATNYYNPRNPGSAASQQWQQQLGQVNFQQIGQHNYVGQTPLYTAPLPPPRPDNIDPTPSPAPFNPSDRFAMGGLLGGLR